jgi:hydroxymethylbilane synthase
MTAGTVTPLRIATRRSPLALRQASWVAGQVQLLSGRATELVEVTTRGDDSSEHLTAIGGAGVFVGAIRDAVLRDVADLAVHSLKDLPTASFPGLVVAAIPVREDPRDVVVARGGLSLGELPSGSRVGTGSPRRASQLRALGLGLEIVPIRGNVDTRLALVTDGHLDAIILARAGLARLNRLSVVTEVMDPIQMLPAPGQGALAIECRTIASGIRSLLGGLDDADSRCAVTAERSLLAALEAGCSAPVGAYAVIADGEGTADEVYLRGTVGSADGSVNIRRSMTGSAVEPDKLGYALAGDMLDAGAAALIHRTSDDLAERSDP